METFYTKWEKVWKPMWKNLGKYVLQKNVSDKSCSKRSIYWFY